MSRPRIYRLGLISALFILFLCAAALGYEHVAPLDWLDEIVPGAGIEVVIVVIAGAMIVLTLLIGSGGDKNNPPDAIDDLPPSLSAWTPQQPITDWVTPASSAPKSFATRPSTVQGRQLSPYLSYYHLAEPPFSIFPDPRFLLLTDRQLAAAPILKPGHQSESRLVTLIGEPGSGKTTLLRRLGSAIDSRSVAGFIPGVTTQSRDIHAWISLAFGISRSGAGKMSPKELVKAFIGAQNSLGKNVLLLVDEAQALTPTMLGELDELVRSPDIQGKLRIILAGSTELRAILQDESLKEYRRSQHPIYDVLTLSYQEMQNYINKRLSIAGARSEIFDETAKETIFYFSFGRPGLVNMLCDLALSYGATDALATISSGTILEIVKDRNRSGLTPFRPEPGASKAIDLVQLS